MNFFAHQAKARSNTSKLVLLFSLAIISLIIITQAFIIVVVAWMQGVAVTDYAGFVHALDIIGTKTFFTIALTIIAVVVIAWLYKTAQLSGGGKTVAEALDGNLVNHNTEDLDERKILNIVEEMAIASGIPVPPVYIIEEQGINAFAAGYSSRDAVIGVTRGCIRSLNREELQGVIAHEFSHIFNGDMRLNIKLIGVLHGIMVIGLIGRLILNASSRSSYSSRRSKGAAPLALIGIGLVVIGYIGVFFGNLIKAAVSRQREFLADASAVQYTRNPDSIGAALKKIGGYPLGSYIEHPEAEELSHLFFNQSLNIRFAGLMATHPPLAERIKRVDPHWQGDYVKVTLAEEVKINPYLLRQSRQGIKIDPDAYKKPEAQRKLDPIDFFAGVAAISPITNTAIQYAGVPTQQHIQEAHQLIKAIPANLTKCAHDTYDVQALIYCLLLDKHRSDVHEKQLQLLEESLPVDIYREVMRIKNTVAVLAPRHRLPLLDIGISTLKQLSKEQYRAFKINLSALIRADNTVDLMEWSLYRMITHHIEDKANIPIKHIGLHSLQEDCRVLLSAVAISNTENIEDARKQYKQGWSVLGLPETMLIEDCLRDIGRLDHALKRANKIHPLKKPQLIKACCACLHNSEDPDSIELVRAIADGLDVPHPPVLSGQKLC